MTKRRAALTFENALSKVASCIGWPKVAEICGHAERTVRNWSDPDTSARMTLEAAFQLDVAFRQAGGEDAPFLLCYRARIEAEMIEMFADRDKLVAAAALVAREAGEAVAASLAAAKPDATQADFILAEREIEESIYAKQGLLATVRAAARQIIGGSPASSAQRAESRIHENGEVRGPEVPPTITT